MTRSFLAVAGAAVLVAVSAVGCDATVDTEDGGGEGACCLMDPQCPPGTLEVSQCFTPECSSVEACCSQKLCEPVVNCTSEPICQPYEIEVASCEGSTGVSCREVSECGGTIFCEEPEFCTAVPVCDEGDELQPSGVCPDDAGCYQLELCGNVITCLDNGLQHGCPPTPPTQGQYCDDFGLTCDYPVDGDCYESWTCADQFLGSDGFDADPGIGAGGGSGAPKPSTSWQSLGTNCEPTPPG